eukprot:12155928-Karenia_brevis.AAC.1
MQSSQTATAQTVGKLQDAVAEEVGQAGVADPEYTRAPNYGILRLGTAQKAHKKDIQDAVAKEWLGGLFSDDQWSISGPDAGNNWTLSFNAIPSRASKMASKARGALRLGGGRWLDVFANDSQGSSCKVYINPDVSPQVARIQTATKRIHGVITELYPALRVAYTKPAFHPKAEPQGVVTANGVDIVAIKAPNAFDE